MGFTRATWKRTAMLLASFSCWVSFGCGGGGGDQSSGGQAGAGGPPTVVKAEDLPEVDTALGPLDEGRVMVAPLSGWFIPSRDSRYVIRFRLAPDIAYPTIVVTAADYESIFDLSPENVEQFAAQVNDEIAQRGESAGLVAPVAPILIDQCPAVSYQRRGKSRKQIVERYFLETVAGGRRYTVELRALRGTLEKFRPFAWAVVHGMEFLETEGPAPPAQHEGPEPEGPQAEPGAEPSGPSPAESGGETSKPPGSEAGETPAGESGPWDESAEEQPASESSATDTPSVIPEIEEELPPS